MGSIKALALYSGGLDSILACRSIMSQGIEVKALQFITPFFGYEQKGREREVERSIAHRYGIPLSIVDVSSDYLALVKNPPHGYGKNFNPCLDCKIFMVSKAREYLKEEGASFIITGEVLGQRPMSQRRDSLRVVERESHAEGILLRPLSAKHLKPTIPEEQGWVDRGRLFDFAGRGRKSQMQLAQEWGIKEYPTPAGGCLLTDPQFSLRIRWLCSNHSQVTVEEVRLITLGRHFVFPGGTFLIVGRRHDENRKIAQLVRKGDIVLELSNHPGPLSLLRGPATQDIVETAASLTVRYSKARENPPVEVAYREEGTALTQLIRVGPLTEQALQSFRIVPHP